MRPRTRWLLRAWLCQFRQRASSERRSPGRGRAPDGWDAGCHSWGIRKHAERWVVQMRLGQLRTGLGLGLALVVLSGCGSLRYKKTDDLWAESDQKFKSGSYADAIPYYDELL